MFKVTLDNKLRIKVPPSAIVSKINNETVSLIKDVGNASYGFLKTNTLFNTARSRQKLFRAVILTFKNNMSSNSAKIYIKKSKYTAHIFATEFGFSSSDKYIHSSKKLMKINTSTLKYQITKSPYIYTPSVKRGLYAGKFMFRTTFDETVRYFKTKYVNNTKFLEKIARIIIEG